jgi:hypothetical protein
MNRPHEEAAEESPIDQVLKARLREVLSGALSPPRPV